MASIGRSDMDCRYHWRTSHHEQRCWMHARSQKAQLLPDDPLPPADAADASPPLRWDIDDPSLSYSPRSTTSVISFSPITQPSSKRVRFADPETTAVSYTDWDFRDVRNSWYREADYGHFERDTRHSVLAVRRVRGDLRRLDPGRHTVTGLEKNLSRRQVLSRKLKTVRHVRTVLDRQRSATDEAELQAVSELFSRPATRRAHLRGVLDQTLLLG